MFAIFFSRYTSYFKVEGEYLGCEIGTKQPIADGVNSGMGITDCGAITAFGNVMNPYILIERLTLPLEVSKANVHVQSQSQDLNPSAMPAGIPCQESQPKLPRISADVSLELLQMTYFSHNIFTNWLIGTLSKHELHANIPINLHGSNTCV